MRKFLPVLTKQDFATRYAAGEFGNCSPTYNTVNELAAIAKKYDVNEFPKVPGLFHLRNRITPMGSTFYNLSWSAAVAKWIEMNAHYQPEYLGDWYCSEMAPTEHTILQGELTYDGAWSQLQLRYSTVKKPMRDALREQEIQLNRESQIQLLLRNVMCANSYEWLWELFDRYPRHAVEFSTYSKPWGTLSPLFNTCFWEVRRY